MAISVATRTRFAPSPTGSLHIGGLRTALYAYALAKHNKGEFILRIEDTDKKREVEGGKEKIKSILKDFNLNWDEGPFVQSERVATGVYQNAADELVSKGKAYKDDGAIRIKIPKDEKISYHDFVLNKDIVWDTNTLEDLVLLKSDGFPTYHLAVVVDDSHMNVTHVLRGHDWLPSTPIHLLIYKFLDKRPPEIGHLTDILDPEGGKLSKRKGSTSVEGLLKEGYLKEAILNFIMLLGWAPKDNREIFTLEEFVQAFDVHGLQKANPVFNRDKLDWFNSQYIQKLTDEEFFENARPLVSKEISDEILRKIVPLVKTRIKKFSELDAFVAYFYKAPTPLFDLTDKYQSHVENALNVLEGIKSEWTLFQINENLGKTIADNSFKTGDFYMDLRGTIAGSRSTPPINESLEILGRDETIKRLQNALELYKRSLLLRSRKGK